MIHHIYSTPKFYHNNRHYLTQWFDNVLLVTDMDICMENNLEQLVAEHSCRNVVVDLSLNSMEKSEIPKFLKHCPVISGTYDDWYDTNPSVHYFPIWFWCYNQRHCSWFPATRWDAGDSKTLPMMCFNRNLPTHRVMLRNLLDSVADQIQYTMGQGIAGDTYDLQGAVNIDIGITHPMYQQCAVNLVTESTITQLSISEKTCKPFAAQQIPVIVGSQGVNQFLKDLGLDMFEDLIPWKDWDNNSDEIQRLIKTADFVKQWVASGSIMHDYELVRNRVIKNKTMLHSQEFKQHILRCMPGK